jgi:hypothetical protein
VDVSALFQLKLNQRTQQSNASSDVKKSLPVVQNTISIEGTRANRELVSHKPCTLTVNIVQARALDQEKKN